MTAANEQTSPRNKTTMVKRNNNVTLTNSTVFDHNQNSWFQREVENEKSKIQRFIMTQDRRQEIKF
jgi:hypothetical protein